MTAARAIQLFLRRGLTFSGRAGRPEFWWPMAIVVALVVAAAAANVLIGGPVVESRNAVRLVPGEGLVVVPGAYTVEVYESGPLAAVLMLVASLPLTAAAWRRMHDSGRPGWLLLMPGAALLAALVLSSFVSGLAIVIALAFLVGGVLTLAWLAHPSDLRPNRFGDAPPS